MGALGALIMALAPPQAELKPAEAGAGQHHQAGDLRAVHPDRLDGVQLHLQRRRRPHLGRAPVHKLPGGALGFLIVVNLLVFILGMFIDFFEIAFIVDPCWRRWPRSCCRPCCRPAATTR
jgi:hypothetical protein